MFFFLVYFGINCSLIVVMIAFTGPHPSGKQMDVSIESQGHGAPAAELLQQVALLSPGESRYKTRKNICFRHAAVCVCKCETVYV